MVGIYKITSPSGRIYIGQSINLEERLRKYKSYGSKSQIRLQRSFNKYGTTSHKFEIIEYCNKEIPNIRERYWQDYYKVTSKNGLNCRLTGTEEKSGHMLESTKNKMISNLKGKFSGENNPFYGKKHSKESGMKMSKSRIGNKNNKGKNHSEDSRKRLSDIAKKRIFHIGYIILDNNTGIFYSQRDLISLLKMDRLKIQKFMKDKNNKRFIYV